MSSSGTKGMQDLESANNNGRPLPSGGSFETNTCTPLRLVTTVHRGDDLPEKDETSVRGAAASGGNASAEEVAAPRRHQLSTDDGAPVPVPLWPKTGTEYLLLGLDFGAAGMFPLGAMSCPSILSATAFIYVFAVFTILAGMFNFGFSTKRREAKTDRPRALAVSQCLGIGHLGLGIWSMALAYPNVGLLSDASPQTCETGPLVCMIIIAAIFSVVFVGLLGYGMYVVTCRRNSSKD